MDILNLFNLTILITLLASGFIQGVLGFGFAILAISILPLLLPLRDAIGLLILLNFVAMGVSVAGTRGHFQWASARSLIIGSVLGVPFGVYVLVSVPEPILLRVFGAIMLLISLNHFALERKYGSKIPQSSGLFVGLLAGALAGSFNIGGPPSVAYVFSRNWPIEEMKATLASVYAATTFTHFLFIGITTDQLPRIFMITLWTSIPIAVAIMAGLKFGRRLNPNHLKTTVFGFLGLTGILHLING